MAHIWYAYFVCDDRTSLTALGPVRIGSTDDMKSIYSLLRSLEAIKEWASSVFYNSLRKWFVCDDDLEGNEDNDGRA